MICQPDTKMTSIDCTLQSIVHQTHDYRHLPGGRPHYEHPKQ
jgi:hypothetical protein